MKPEDLKLYGKYKYKNVPRELIYIGEYNDKYYFIYKSVFTLPNTFFTYRNFNFFKIVKDLNLELNIFNEVKEHDYTFFYESQLKDIKPLLKDKLKNIINR